MAEPTGSPFESLWHEAESLKEQGNEHFSKAKYAMSITSYTDALLRLPSRHEPCPDASLQDQVKDTRTKVYTNLAAAHLKLVCTSLLTLSLIHI